EFLRSSVKCEEGAELELPRHLVEVGEMSAKQPQDRKSRAAPPMDNGYAKRMKVGACVFFPYRVVFYSFI
ncbi:hypothetical protein KIPB_017018, partial [Kipferlia bialata]